MAMSVLHTERFILRPWTLDDVEAAFRMYGDPEVTRYLGSGASEPDLDSQRTNLEKVIAKYEVLGEEGYGFWAAEERSTGEVVAAALLKPIVVSEGHIAEEKPEIEVGWHVARAHWGRGIATEMGRRCLAHGFDDVSLDKIIAVAYAENPNSLRVMEKIGMRLLGETDRYYGRNLVAYLAERPLA